MKLHVTVLTFATLAVAGCGGKQQFDPALPKSLWSPCRHAASVIIQTASSVDASGSGADFTLPARDRADMDKLAAKVPDTSKIDRWVKLARAVDDERRAAKTRADVRALKSRADAALKELLASKSFKRDCGA